MGIRRILLILTLVAFSIGSAVGCNTIRGVGRDIEKGGQKLQDAAH